MEYNDSGAGLKVPSHIAKRLMEDEKVLLSKTAFFDPSLTTFFDPPGDY